MMLKKLLLVLTILTTSLFSFQVDIWKEDTNAILNFNKYYDNVGGDEGSNWVAIYKAGDSNDWDNVITWSWANDLVHNEAGNYDERVLPLVTDEGDYEVRFFLNNSYDVFATYSYSNGGGNNNATLGIVDKTNISITFNNTIADKAWIGIYNKGASNDWDNVKAWSWAKGASTEIDISNLPNGTYEARLFYNNSYNVETTVEFINEGGGNDKGYLSIEKQTSSKIILNSTGADQAWIGIYNKGDSNDWENVKAWDWVNNPTTIDISNLAQGTYEARLFYNNSYDIETTLEFTVSNNSIENKILKDLSQKHSFINNIKIINLTRFDNDMIVYWKIDDKYDRNLMLSYYRIDGNNIEFKTDLKRIRDRYMSFKAVEKIGSKIFIDTASSGRHQAVDNSLSSFDTNEVDTVNLIREGNFDDYKWVSSYLNVQNHPNNKNNKYVTVDNYYIVLYSVDNHTSMIETIDRETGDVYKKEFPYHVSISSMRYATVTLKVDGTQLINTWGSGNPHDPTKKGVIFDISNPKDILFKETFVR